MAQIEGAKLAIDYNVGGEKVEAGTGRRGFILTTDPIPSGTGTYGSGGTHSEPDGHGGWWIIHSA